MNKRILNKKYFIRSQANNYVYCSKTGKRVCQDKYNLVKHAERNNFAKNDFNDKIFRENQDFAYAFKGYEDRFDLMIYTPILKKGYVTQQFLGGEWKKVYRCSFFKDGHIEERGLRDLEYWRKRENIDLLNQDSFYTIMYNNFHIPGIESFSMFVQIWKGKGFRYKEIFSLERAHEEIKRMEAEESTLPDYHHLARYYRKFRWLLPKFRGKVRARLVENTGEFPILALEIQDNRGGGAQRALVAQDYFYSEDELELDSYFSTRMTWEIPQEDLEIFDKAYPTFGLKRYMDDGGANPLIPLFAANYDRVLELLYKSGCIEVAEHYYIAEWKKNKDVHTEGKNIKEIFGVPVNVLKKMSLLGFMENNVWKILQDTFQLNPEFLKCLGGITPTEIEFLDKNVLALQRGERPEIRMFSRIDQKMQLRITKHMFEGCIPIYQGMYVDYLNMAYRIDPNRPICGYTPRDVCAAHDEAMHILNQDNKLGIIKENEFQEMVQTEKYLSRESDYGEESTILEKDDYTIISPKNTNELRNEGKLLHHCVATYIDRVIEGNSLIYFLRKIEEPDKPYGTIEIQGNTVIQVKGKYNHQVEKSAQRFVKKWAKIKNLQLKTLDLSI